MSGLADIAFSFSRDECLFEDSLMESDNELDWEELGWDEYDCSLEIKGVPSDVRLSYKTQKIIHDNGFITCYVNHVDNWETHYNWQLGNFKPVEGWRVSYPHKSGYSKIRTEKKVESWDDEVEYEIIEKKPSDE